MRYLTLILALLLLTAAAAELTGKEILEKIDAVFTVDSMWSGSTQTITTPEGETRSFTMESMARDSNRQQLTRYLTPQSVAGTAFLMLDYGNDIWTYFPDTDRTRQLAANARNRSVMGSNLSYEDMASEADYAENYSAEVLRQEEYAEADCYVLKLIPLKSSSSYSKMILWVDEESWVTLRCDYYDKGGELLKRMRIRDIRYIDGTPTPFYYEMEGLQDGSMTEVTMTKVRYDMNLPESLFTTANLSR